MSWIKERLRNSVLSNEEQKILERVAKVKAIPSVLRAPKKRVIKDTVIKGMGPKFRYIQGFGVRRPSNDRELREIATSPTPAACIDRLVSDFISTPWRIVPVNPKETSAETKNHIESITNFFLDPNHLHERLENIWAKTMRDILVTDNGVIVKHFTYSQPRKMTEIVNIDGCSVLKEQNDLGYPGKRHEHVQYSVMVKDKEKRIEESNVMVHYWQHHLTKELEPIPFRDYELIYLMKNPLSWNCYGLSPVQVLDLRLKTLIQSDIATNKYFENGEIAKGMMITDIDTPLDDNAWERWTSRMETNIKEAHSLVYSDTKAKLQPLGLTRRDMQWLEQQEEYRLSVCAMFSVTPVMLGWTTRDVTKGTDESQREVYLRKGLWPLLRLWEYHTNMEILTEFFINEKNREGEFAGKTPDCVFTFDLFDPVEEQRWLERAELAAKNGIKTVNEIRGEHGLPPVKWGDVNPASMLAIQQFAQSVFMGGMTPEQFRLVTGIPDIGDILKLAEQTTPETPEEKKKYWHLKFDAWMKRRHQ